jgi:N-acylneuraminate cytidylyltransferase
MSYIAIIPARGGSKRLPGKNIKLFGNYPLIAYSIERALRSSNIKQVYVSTDDDEIETVAERYGASVIRRPEDLASDTSTTTSALIHCLQHIHSEGFQPKGIITLQATNPLRDKDLIDDCIDLFEQNEVVIDSLITVSENKHKLGRLKSGFYEPATYTPEQRSQDIEALYYENGLLYITKPDVLLNDGIFGKRIYTYITQGIYTTVDIDTIEDFEIGEILLEKYKQHLDFKL